MCIRDRSHRVPRYLSPFAASFRPSYCPSNAGHPALSGRVVPGVLPPYRGAYPKQTFAAMARLLASRRSVWGAVAFATMAGATPAPPAPTRAATPIETAASHSYGRPSVWASYAFRVYGEVERRSVRLAPAERTRVARAILEESLATALDPLLVVAVIHVESQFDPRAVSPAGAMGLMQLMPPTMREQIALSRLTPGDPLDPVANVRAGVRYLARLRAAFESMELALVAYNAGPARLRAHLRAGTVPKRLRAYPRAVLARHAHLSMPPEGSVAAGRATPRVRLAAAHRNRGGLAEATLRLAPVLDRAGAATSPAAPLGSGFAQARGARGAKRDAVWLPDELPPRAPSPRPSSPLRGREREPGLAASGSSQDASSRGVWLLAS